jgi:ubiquinone/menaquinone biosynthesis methyltransferase
MPVPVADVHARSGTEHAESVRSMFDAIAPTYDRLNRVMSLGIDRRWRKAALRELGCTDRAALDLCAGTMDIAQALIARQPGARVVASDFAKEMLDAGANKAPAAERVVADAMALPFADGEFDRTICGFGIRNVQDTAKAVREVRRTLAPGGVFVTLEFFKPTKVATQLFHAAYGRVVLPTLGAAISGRGYAYKYLSESMSQFLTREEYMRLLSDVGFQCVTGRDLTLGVASLVRAEVPR